MRTRKLVSSVRTVEQINGREGETATFLSNLSVKFKVARFRFRPTSSQPFDAFGLFTTFRNMGVKFFLITIALLIALSCVNVYSQSRLHLQNKPLQNELLIEILNDSEMKELVPPSPKHSKFFLRLYSIGELGTCAPDVETEVTCSFRYYLAVSDGGLGVPRKVYDLGQVGEITDIKWLENSKSDIDNLRLEITNYPTHAFELNPKLIRKSTNVELEVRLDSLMIKPIK